MLHLQLAELLEKNRIDISLKDNKKELKRFSCEIPNKGLSSNLKYDLQASADHFYVLDRTQYDSKNIAARLISYGQQLGDACLGEDFELQAVKDLIEDHGYSDVSVTIEHSKESSNNVVREAWETLILPESPYVLSSVVGSFKRTYHYDCSDISDFKLEVGDNLNILKIVSSAVLNHAECLGDYLSLIHCSDLVKFDLEIAGKAADIEQQLATRSNQMHLIHYQGPISISGDEILLTLENSEVLAWNDFCKMCVEHGVEAVYFSVTEIITASEVALPGPSQDSAEIAADAIFQRLARISSEFGVANLIFLEGAFSNELNNENFSLLIKNIVAGHDLDRAVVECRKELQRLESLYQAGKGLIAHYPWASLVHYSTKRLKYYISSNPTQDLCESQPYANIRENLHGFRSEYLPPTCTYTLELGLCSYVDALDKNGMIALLGGDGIGKTYSSHLLGYYIASRDSIPCFYFDFERYPYSYDDISTMISGIARDGEPSLFVFDNFSEGDCAQFSKSDVGKKNKVTTLIDGLVTQGNKVVVTGRSGFGEAFQAKFKCCQFFSLGLLNDKDRDRLSGAILQKIDYSVTADKIESMQAVLSLTQGHPFLISHLFPLALVEGFDTLLDGLKVNISTCPETGIIINPTQEYYQWRWSKLSKAAKTLLILFSENPELTAEIITATLDGDSSPEITRFCEMIQLNKTASSLLDELTAGGFVIAFPHGRNFNQSCTMFLNSISVDHDQVVDPSVSTQFDNVLNIAMARVALHLQKSPNQFIHRSVLAVRRVWARAMEGLFLRKQYGDYCLYFDVFSRFLRDSKLADELAEWAESLMNRNGCYTLDGNLDAPTKLAYLKTLSAQLHTSDVNKLTENQALIAAAKDWFVCLEAFSEEEVDSEPDLFVACYQFLETWYARTGEWQTLKRCALKALNHFERNDVTPLVLSTLGSICAACYKTDDLETAHKYQELMVSWASRDGIAHHILENVMTKIVLERLNNSDGVAAQAMLDRLKDILLSNSDNTLSGLQRQSPLLDLLQADIYYSQKQYDDADALYLSVLEHHQHTLSQQHVEEINKRLSEMASTKKLEYCENVH